jgi:hypothetical protein
VPKTLDRHVVVDDDAIERSEPVCDGLEDRDHVRLGRDVTLDSVRGPTVLSIVGPDRPASPTSEDRRGPPDAAARSGDETCLAHVRSPFSRTIPISLQQGSAHEILM